VLVLPHRWLRPYFQRGTMLWKRARTPF